MLSDKDPQLHIDGIMLPHSLTLINLTMYVSTEGRGILTIVCSHGNLMLNLISDIFSRLHQYPQPTVRSFSHRNAGNGSPMRISANYGSNTR